MARKVLFATLLVLAAGCGGDGSDVARFSVPRVDNKKLPEKAPGVRDRMLAVLVKEKDATWSFRLSGPEPAVSALQPKFEEFLKTIKFAEKPPVNWKLPEGWIEFPGDGVRMATIKTGPDPNALDVTVVELPKKGGELLPNVNRWRGQLSLPPADLEDLPKLTKDVDVDGRKGTLVDLVGKFAAKGKMPPLMGKDQPAPIAPAAEKLTFDVPAGWAKVKPKNSMIRDQFDVVDGAKKAEATIVVLPGGAGGVFANLHRWRGQIKLPPANDEDLLDRLVKVKIPAGPAIFADLDNPKADGDNRILGLILPRPAGTYFVKMVGPSELVGREKERFEEFYKSLKFEP